MRKPAVLLPLAALASAGVLTGCGGGVGTQPPGELPAADAAIVLGAERTISRACSGDQESRRGLPDAVSRLVDETRENPDKTYESGSSERAIVMYEFARQLSEDLRECGADAAGDADALAEAARQAREAV